MDVIDLAAFLFGFIVGLGVFSATGDAASAMAIYIIYTIIWLSLRSFIGGDRSWP